MTRIMTFTVLMILRADFELSEVRTAELKERHQDVTNVFAIYEKNSNLRKGNNGATKQQVIIFLITMKKVKYIV